ncbi:hypothetical protein ACF9IK_16570 [Kitasatospora hibisci]|uniref:hypothetical protein n=1 Tax=Kitasatospora hibisci TaxID=3369522 RepID=UPI003754E77F
MSVPDSIEPADPSRAPGRRRTIAELLSLIENNPIRFDLTTGLMVELVSESDGMAIVHPLFTPDGPRRRVPSGELVRRLSDGVRRD